MTNKSSSCFHHGTFATFATLAVLLLAACGGGSSSGGGGGASVADTGGATGSNPGNTSSGGTPSYAGSYGGFATSTMSAPGMSPQTVTGTILFVIDAQGNVTSDPGTDFSGTGTLNGNSFTVSIPASFANQPGVNCTGSVVLQGTISGNKINGTVSQSGFTCNGVPFELTGTFSVMRTAGAAVMPSGGSVMDSLRDAVRATR